MDDEGVPPFASARFAIACLGSRGDFEPYLALGCGLRRKGCRVKFFTSEDHCQHAREFGFEAEVTAPKSFQHDICDTEAGRKAMASGCWAMCAETYYREWPQGREEMDEFEKWKAFALFDFKPHVQIMGTLSSTPYPGPTASVMINGSYEDVVTHTVPMLFVPLLEPPEADESPLLWHIMDVHSRAAGCLDTFNFAEAMGASEQDLRGLGSPEKMFATHLAGEEPSIKIHGMSPALFPSHDDWPHKQHPIIGQLRFLPEEQLEAASSGSFFNQDSGLDECREFLAAGPAPVYVGWGSMAILGPEELTKGAVAILQASGRRGIILSGYAKLSMEALMRAEGAEELARYCDGNVLFMKAAPHAWLFPQCACCIHHGGIGTLHASARAGVPSIVTPVFSDQFNHARHVESMGIGRGTEQLVKLIAKPQEFGRLVNAVCEDGQMLARCRELAAQMEKEDGVGECVRLLEEWYNSDVVTGEFFKKQQAWEEARWQERRKNAKKSMEQISASWELKLRNIYPAMKRFTSERSERMTRYSELVKANRLWYVKASSCLVRAGESIKSEEAGRFRSMAFLEELEQKQKGGLRLRMRKLRGKGPEEGWVSPVVNGAEILKRVENYEEFAVVHSSIMAKRVEEFREAGLKTKE